MLSKNLYFIVYGHGYVSKKQSFDPVSSVDGTMIVQVADTTDFEDQVGSTLFVSDSDIPELPNGYYTLAAVDNVTFELTLKGDLILAGAGPGSLTSFIRVEDFYKISTGVPDYVTGELAAARWLPLITGLTETLGQKIELLGGASTISGLTISTAYSEADAFTDLLRLDPVKLGSLADPTNSTIYMYSQADSADLTLEVNTVIQVEALSTDVSFNHKPIWITNQEAILISAKDENVPEVLDVDRGILKTGYYTDYWTNPSGDPVAFDNIAGIRHSRFEIMYSGIPNSQGARCEIYTFDTDTASYDDHDLIYFGLMDNIEFENGFSQIDFEISSAILTGKVNNFASKASRAGKARPIYTFGDGGSSLYYSTVEQPNEFAMWKWMRIGSVALQLRDADLTRRVIAVPNSGADDGAYNPSSGMFTVYYPIDNLTWYQDPDGTIDPLNLDSLSNPLNYMDNYVMLDYQADTTSFNRFSRGTIDASGNILIADAPYFYRDFVDVEEPNAAFRVGLDYMQNSDASLCHVFEPVINFAPFSRPLGTGNPAFYYPRICVYDLILQILLSKDGNQKNTIFDLLPTGMGLGLPTDKIDFKSFGLVSYKQLFDLNDPEFPIPYYDFGSDVAGLRNLVLQGVSVDSKDIEDILSWLTKNVLKPYGLLLVQDQAGRISISDISNANINSPSVLALTDADLADEGARVDVKLTNDSSKIFSSITYNWRNPSLSPSLSTIREASATFRNTLTVLDSEKTIIGTGPYTTQAAPIVYNMKYAPIYNTATGTSNEIVGRGVFLLRYVSQPLPTFTFRVRTSAIRPSYLKDPFTSTPKIGDLATVSFSNAIGPNGKRGFIGNAIVTDLKEDILRQVVVVTIALISSLRFEAQTTWGSSAYVTGIVGGIASQIAIDNFYGPNVTSIFTGNIEFEVGDLVLLYDKAFNLLSKDALGDPRPQEITSISETQMNIDSTFKNSAGTTITPNDGNIILLASRDLQPEQTALDEAFMSDNHTVWR